MIVQFALTPEQQAQMRRFHVEGAWTPTRTIHFRTEDSDLWARCPVMGHDGDVDYLVLPDGSWLACPTDL